MKVKKILSVFLTLLTLFAMFNLSAYALSWDGSSAGGSTNAVNGSSKGYVIRDTNDTNCVVGYRFSVVDSDGSLKVSKVIDVYRNTGNGNNAYSNSAKFSKKYNKKQVIAHKDDKLDTTSNTTNCYKEKDLSFLSSLPNPSGVETWQKYETNINKILTKIGVGTTSNMIYGDKVIIEPLFDVCLAGEYQALTVSEIAYCGRSVKGGSSDGGTSNGTSSTWGFIANYTNRIWPNKLYTPDGQGLWTAASKISDSSKETFSNILTKGYGAGIAYKETTNITYTIKFNGNGSTSGSTASMSMVKDVAKNLTANGFKKTGHTFSSWNTKSDGSGTKYTNKQSVKNLATKQGATVNLYARWTPNKYTVTYNANSGSGAPSSQTKTYGVSLTLSSTKPTRTGYTFSKWNTKTDGTGTAYSAGGSYTSNANLTLYAQWTPNKYTVTYNANGGSGAPSSQTKTYGVSLTLSSTKPTRTGYTFSKWNTKADGTGTAYSAGGSYTSNENLTLYAQWKKLEEEHPLSLEAIEPNADYREGTDVISSFNIVNDGNTNCIPDNNANVVFKVYKNSTVIKTVTLNKVVVPANSENRIYFKWTVPENIGSATIYIGGELTVNGKSESVIKNAYPTCKYVISSTPDTQFEYYAPDGFSVPAAPSAKSTTAKWSEWKYESGAFKKYDYGIAISDDAPALTPTASANALLNNGMWTMKSGYGVEITLKNAMKSISGYTMPSSGSYTSPQYSTVKFPEFSYSSSSNKYRTLELVSGNWVFRTNGTYGRIHFTPLWYPDGKYSVSVIQRDCWTPAGMISKTSNTKDITISGSAYDDWIIH